MINKVSKDSQLRYYWTCLDKGSRVMHHVISKFQFGKFGAELSVLTSWTNKTAFDYGAQMQMQKAKKKKKPNVTHWSTFDHFVLVLVLFSDRLDQKFLHLNSCLLGENYEETDYSKMLNRNSPAFFLLKLHQLKTKLFFRRWAMIHFWYFQMWRK